MLNLLIIGLVFLGLVLWLLLHRHEKRRMARGLPSHSGFRLIFAAAGLLTMLVTGGCALLLATAGLHASLPAIALYGVPPFAVGLLVCWLAMRRKKERS